jgi:RNA polymerase sigma-70 factor, ECF subfamily
MKEADLASLLVPMLPRLWTFALRLCHDREDAADLVQRACVRGLERAHHLHPCSVPLSWMFSIIHSTWVNELRARRLRNHLRTDWDDSLMETVEDSSAPTLDQQVMAEEIMHAVMNLSESQRIVILLVAVEGYSYGEASKILGVPIGTVMSRISRARRALGAIFGVEDRKGGAADADVGTSDGRCIASDGF